MSDACPGRFAWGHWQRSIVGITKYAEHATEGAEGRLDYVVFAFSNHDAALEFKMRFG